MTDKELISKYIKAHTIQHKKKTHRQLDLKMGRRGDPIVSQWVKNPTSIHEDAGLITDVTHWVNNLVLP